MTEQIDLINERFKGAKFVVSCFNTIEEVDTKVLNRKNKTIIFSDLYELSHWDKQKGTSITDKV